MCFNYLISPRSNYLTVRIAKIFSQKSLILSQGPVEENKKIYKRKGNILADLKLYRDAQGLQVSYLTTCTFAQKFLISQIDNGVIEKNSTVHFVVFSFFGVKLHVYMISM